MISSKIKIGIYTGLLFALLSSVHAAQTIKGVLIKNIGAGQVDEGFVYAHIALKPGAELDGATLSKDVKALLASGRFSWVGTDVEAVAGGVRLTFSIRNKLLLDRPITVTGCDYFREGKILDLIGLQPGDLVDDQVMGVRTQQVIEKYRKDYFPDISVTWKIAEIDHTRGTAKVAVQIKEGNRAKVKRTDFIGNKVFSAGDLRKSMKQPAWWNPCWWLKKKRYDQGEFESARAEITNLYLGKGYVDAKVDISEARYDEKGNLKVVVKIDEGPLYKFGKVTLSGAKLFPETELKRFIRAKAGMPASSDILRASVQGLQDFYGSRGYVDSAIRPVMDTDDAKRIVNIDLAITEGIQSKIRNIKIEGNTRTKDKVIRRELLVYPGEIFDEVKVRRSERIVNNLGYFKTVRSYPTKTLVPDEKDLVLEVEEKRTGQFMISAGFSSIDRMIGMLELSQGNFDLFGWPYFTGGGQKIKFTSQFGSRRKFYEISFVEPWFLDRKLSLGVDLYLSDVNYTDYDIERKGVAVTLGKPITRADRIELQYSIEKERLRDIADTNAYVTIDTGEEYFFSDEPETFKSSVQLTLLHDTRDNPFLPTRGNRLSIFGSISGGVLGLDTDIYQLGARVNQYVPLWFGHVFSLRGRCEVVDSYSDTETVPITDRLFLGGGRTLRGFDYRDVGPKAIRKSDYDSGTSTGHYRPVGGRSMAMASAEYTIPVVSIVRIALFFDIGNVWSDTYDFHPNDLAMSTGMGLRLDLPGFPIKIDYGWVVRKDDDLTDEEPWIVWIGPDY
ncbi:MAG: outer membrane protein assembly factor BamA [Kiritimatiellae bacterium]|nr:outer membrane protein assembly factor BamA [Kiritimatiellia bacterium]MDD5522141.1 outer membrane protein assembly factor BamA [Kiritimatiellia bacterium]